MTEYAVRAEAIRKRYGDTYALDGWIGPVQSADSPSISNAETSSFTSAPTGSGSTTCPPGAWIRWLA
ncbi:hypothetical protein [Streptomyces sp. NPDC058653]|uniref:hypothetical protein n=1 Tax=Streptomyces sp. NPDC058653 TaxID=3346576 RepID=UPI00364786C7